MALKHFFVFLPNNAKRKVKLIAFCQVNFLTKPGKLNTRIRFGLFSQLYALYYFLFNTTSLIAVTSLLLMVVLA